LYKNIDILDTPLDDTIIWRYMNFTQFVAMLEKRALFFRRIDLFEDPFEGSLPLREVNGRVTILKMMGANEEQARNENEMQANHWLSTHESAAMWKLYTNETEGLAIRTTIVQLKDSLKKAGEEIYIGKVNYIDFEKDTIKPNTSCTLNYLTIKRKSFEYENELRLLAGEKWLPHTIDMEHDKNPEDKSVKCILSNLIKEVYVSPQAKDRYMELIGQIIGRYDLKVPVKKSKLDDEALF